MEIATGRPGSRRCASEHSERVGSRPALIENSETWPLERSPKHSGIGTARTIPPSATIRLVRPLMPEIGVTRVAEVTHLDRNGIPNFIAVRPREAGRGISYYNGKGPTRTQARASAMMEAIERFSAETCDAEVVVARFEDLIRESPAIDPRDLLLPPSDAYSPSMVLEWVRGYDLLGLASTYVPLNAVVCPYRPVAAPLPFLASSHGLASGNTSTEALCHALCEVNERDAHSVYFAGAQLQTAISGLLAKAGRGDKSSSHRITSISIEGLPHRADRLVSRLTRARLDVHLHDMTTDTGIAAISCVVGERRQDGSVAHHAGYGSHPDARVALVRAVTEAAQSRVACIQGGREDLPEFAVDRQADPFCEVGEGPSRPFDSIPSRVHDDIADDVSWTLDRFRLSGFRQVVAIDLTRPELGVPVVRVVVPGAETWAAFRCHTSRLAIGRRSLQQARCRPSQGAR